MIGRHAVRLLRLCAAVAVVLAIPAAMHAIFVLPTAVFMDHRAPSAQVTIGNAGESPEEAEIQLQFGFPDTDETGTPFVRLIEYPGPEFPSAAEWIRPFPRRVRLEPGDRQVVRLLAQPPPDLPDGEYWTRMIVTGRGATAPVTSPDTAVRVGITLEVRLVAAVTYRKGRITTGITVGDFTAEATGDSLITWARFTREGNGAYLGTATFELLDAGRRTVRSWPAVMAVYYPQRRRFSFPLAGLGSGEYLLKLTLKS
ncbi:MAG TPA: hypothetical protein VNL18_13055, partial [Gemmatimonadales bacterium]|nr:hypothetical protein [Gemmatimonadales bacterium]